MIIKGNAVGNPMPRTNYEQTDPEKADYLKGKDVLDRKILDAQNAAGNAQTAAENAQTAADNAQTCADNAQTAADRHSGNKENPHGVTAAQIGARPDTWMPTASEVGALSAVESTDYPGCFYRTVDGVAEWLNPPMVLGTEYRTVERYKGSVVYIKAVNFGALPDQDQKSVSTGISYANLVSCIGYTRNSTDKLFEIFPVLAANVIAAQSYYEDKSIFINTFGIGENYKECVFYVKYTK